MNRLILQVLQVMHPNIRGGDISFILELGPDVPEIVADGIQIQQVLLNLISNAIHSVNASGSFNRTLIVRSRLSKEEVVVDVEDTGIGIRSQYPLRGVLHNEGKTHGHRPCNLPVDHRRTWWRSRCHQSRRRRRSLLR